VSHGIATLCKGYQDDCSQLGSCDALAALVDSATMPRGVTVASAMSLMAQQHHTRDSCRFRVLTELNLAPGVEWF
jgi:hypothetical protein